MTYDHDNKTEDEHRQFVAKTNEEIQQVCIRRCAVLARRSDKAALSSTKEKAKAKHARKAAHHRATALRLASCGTQYAWVLSNGDNTPVMETNYKGEVVSANRTARCDLNICHRCHGRSTNHGARISRVASAGEHHGLYQLVIHVAPPTTRSNYAQSLSATTMMAKKILSDETWSSWAMGTAINIELTPRRLADVVGPPRFHLHLFVALREEGEGIPTTVLAALAALGVDVENQMGDGHGPVADDKVTTWFSYQSKSHSPKAKLSPYLYCRDAIIDGALEAVASKKTLALFSGAFANDVKKSSSTKKTSTKKNKVVATKEDAHQRSAQMLRVPDVVVVVVGDEEEVAEGEVAHLSLVRVDRRGRRRAKYGLGVIVAVARAG